MEKIKNVDLIIWTIGNCFEFFASISKILNLYK